MKKFSLGTRISFGFGAVIVLTLILGVNGYLSNVKNSNAINELGAVSLPGVKSLATLDESIQRIKVVQRNLLNPALDEETRSRQYTNFAKVTEDYQKAWKQYDILIKSAEQSAQYKQLQEAWAQWRSDMDEFIRLANELHAMGVGDPNQLRQKLEIFRGDHYRLEGTVLKAINTKQLFEGGDDPTKCNFGRWKADLKLTSPELRKAIQETEASHNQFHETTKKIKEVLKSNDQAAAMALYTKDMASAAEHTLKNLEIMAILAGNSQDHLRKMEEQAIQVSRKSELKLTDMLDKAGDLIVSTADKTSKEAITIAERTKVLALTMVIASIAGGLLLAFFITRGITKPIKRIVQDLNASAEQVASASTQVSSASQSLAEGTSEQAAAIEETSSSLEEMSSMTKHNSTNANQANQLMSATNETVSQASRSMEMLTSSMGEISRASEETSKIIKTIDEIAFQTNLLALNAAVEAARAGEAGAGFAVVADEVRNLAMRAAEAAKNTADLIEGTVKKVKEGSELVGKTDKEFNEVAASVERSRQLIGEISAASVEQSQGVEQVNKAVGEMDKVVQRNAANVEECASASEEMSAQAEQMKVFVEELVGIVGRGADKGAGSERSLWAGLKKRKTESSERTNADSSKLTIANHVPRTAKANGPSKMKTRPAAQVIPLEGVDLVHF